MNHRSILGDTKSKVFNYLNSQRFTAGEVAEKLGIQLSAARKHLESLRSRDLVKEEYVIDGVGRPKKFYSLTGSGRDLFQNQSSAVLNLILTEISKNSGPSSVNNVLKQIAKEIAESMHVSGSKTKQQIESLTASLDKFGFETSLEEDDQSYTIVSHHCPLQDNANKHRELICIGLHNQVIKSALAADDVNLEKCMAVGDRYCRHVIQKAEMKS